MFDSQFNNEFLKSIAKLSRKDKQLSIELKKKISQIISCDEISIEHYKNLRNPLQEYKRVHVRNYVILFRVKDKTVYFERFEHHDDAYEI
jgi:YafQ family addiction module toxin component